MKFTKEQTLTDFQQFIKKVYGLTDDRIFSLWDLVSNLERFTMRALKGIRKEDHGKLQDNLLISISYFMTIANRLHIDMEDMVWKRFPALCSYCGEKPCQCKAIKPEQRKIVIGKEENRPITLKDFQTMFNDIYPAKNRTLPEAGVHLAEEVGELSEAIQTFLGEHKSEQFEEIAQEGADFLSCLFGVANSANIDMAEELAKIYHDNCHVCHQAPCTCNFSSIASFKS